jgi:cytochrome P450
MSQLEIINFAFLLLKVWNESVRLYPPIVTFLIRHTEEDTVVNGIFIGKGVIVQAPVWHIHHDENIWPDPFKFDPERFSPENK